ncbi:MAG: GNAT family N-acetyltransferase [Candidatus Hodarchaeota archaeon]
MSNDDLKIYSNDDAFEFLNKNMTLIKELMGKDDLYRYPVTWSFLNPAYLKYLLQMSDYLYVGTIEEDGEIYAILPFSISLGFPSPNMNRIEYLVMKPKTNLDDIESLFKKVLAVVDSHKVPLRFYFHEFVNPKVKDIVLKLGFKETGSIKGLVFDLNKDLDLPVGEEATVTPAEDPTTWFPMMLSYYGLPSAVVDHMTNVLSKQEEGLQDLMKSLFHRYIAHDSTGEIIGAIEFWTSTEYPQWTHLSVKDEYRRRGYGISIMMAMWRKSVELNYTKALGIVDSTNTPAYNLFTKLGAEVTSLTIYFDRLQSE